MSARNGPPPTARAHRPPPEMTEEQPERVTLEDAFAMATDAHRRNRHQEAERLYRAILHAVPDHVDTLHFLGLLMHQGGAPEEGAALIARAVELRPDYVDAVSNLGNVLRAQGHLEQAADAYRRAIAIARHPQAYNNLGVVLSAMGRYEEAETALLTAIEIDPERGDARFNLANVYSFQRRAADAAREYRIAIDKQPLLVAAYDALARNLRSEGRHDEAIEVLQTLLAKSPDHPVARHMLAAYGLAEVPAQASDGYVTQIFDTFADSFENVLTALEYRAPEVLDAIVRARLPAQRPLLDVLDAGCGTGWSGPLLRPLARSLVGVDLSPGMLAKARARKLYDQLVCGELTQYLNGHRDSFDLIVSADTLIYFGDLTTVLRACAAALRSPGLIAFTLEHATTHMPASGYRLCDHGRYEHSAEYVRRVLVDAGFSDLRFEEQTVRLEKTVPVPGLIVSAAKA
jgi:predicted TPR repeat methyltransferase